jgi:hypothetical protein
MQNPSFTVQILFVDKNANIETNGLTAVKPLCLCSENNASQSDFVHWFILFTPFT